MEFVNSHGAFKSLHVDFADYHPAKFERLGDLSAGRATRKVILTFLRDVDCREHVDFFPRGLLSARVTQVHQASWLQRARVPGVQHRTPNGVLPMAGAQVLPSGGDHPLHIWEMQDNLHCNGKSCISSNRSHLARLIHGCR